MKTKLFKFSAILAVSLLSGCGDSSSSDDNQIIQNRTQNGVSTLSTTVNSTTYTKNQAIELNSEEDTIRYVGSLEGMANCDTSKYVVVQQPKHGTIIIHDNGYYTYIANDDFVGKDSFTYKASEDSACEPCCVTIQADIENSQKAQMPSNLTIEETNCDGVYEFNWSDNSDNEDSFVIYQDGKPIYITCPNQITQELTLELDEDKEYKFEVASMNEKGISEKSSFILNQNPDKQDKPIQRDMDLEIISSITFDNTDTYLYTPVSNKDDSLLFYASTMEGITSYDITNPSDPQLLESNYDAAPYPTYMTLSQDDKTAYVISFNQLYIVDVSDPKNMRQISGYKYISYTTGIYLSKDEKYLYIPTEFEGIFIIDISDPTNPVRVGAGIRYEVYLYTVSEDKTEYYVFNYDETYTLKIVDNNKVIKTDVVKIDIPTDEAKKAWLLEHKPNVVSKDKNTLFIVSKDDNTLLEVYDISDDNNPQLITELKLEEEIDEIALSNDEQLLYITHGNKPLDIVKISE